MVLAISMLARAMLMLARAIINAVTRTRFNFRQTSRIKNTTPTTSTAHINKTTYCSVWQLSDQH